MSNDRPSTRVVALGELGSIEGYALAGVTLLVAQTDDAILECWNSLAADTGVVILTTSAADVLGQRVDEPTAPMTVVLPR